VNANEALVEHFSSIASQFNDIVYLLDKRGTIVDVSDRLLARYGHAREALIGQPVTALCPAEDADDVRRRIGAILRDGSLRVRVMHATCAGLHFPVEVRARRIEHGGRPYIHGVVHDLTALHDVEAALASSEERLRLATEAGRVGIWDWDLSTNAVVWNRVLAEHFDIPASGFRGRYKDFGARVHAEDRALFEARVNEARERHTSFAMEFRVPRGDGMVRWLNAQGAFEYGPDGAAVHMRGTAIDVTPRRIAEARAARLGRIRGALNDINRAITHQTEEAGLFAAVCDAIVAAQAAGYCSIARIDPENETLVQMAAAGANSTMLDGVVISIRGDLPQGQGPTGRAAREGVSQVVDDYRVDPRVAAFRPLAEEFGMRSGAAFPLRRAGRVWGALAVYDAQPAAFDRELRTLFEDAATDVSFALDVMDKNRERAESEQRFRAMVEQSISGIYIIDESGVLLYANPRYAEILGYESPDDLIGHNTDSLVLDSELSSVKENRHTLVSGEVRAASFSFTAIRKDDILVEIGAHRTAIDYQGRRAIIGIMQDISEKKRAEARALEYVEKLERAVHSTIEVVSAIGEMRDPYTHGHERRVGELAAAIAAEMGLDTDRVEGIRIGGYLHDVGKISAPAEILAKPGRLSPIEMELIRQHAQQGYEILKGVQFAWPVAEMAWSHHERLDGSGYPRGLKGDEIILEARILSVADVVEAMTTHRPYRAGLGIDRALAEVERGRGTHYDLEAVDACMRLFREKSYSLDT